MKKIFTRRNFLSGTAKLGAAGLFLDYCLDQIIWGRIRKLMAQDDNTNYNYVGLYLPDGPPRWMFDLPIYNGEPTSDGAGYYDVNGLIKNPMVATGWTNNTSSGGGELTPKYKLIAADGIYLPPLWTGYEDFAKNCLFLRGITNTPIHGHYIYQFTPRPGYPSTHAFASIVNELTIPCVEYDIGVVPFIHPNNKIPLVALGSTAQEIQDSIFAPFKDEEITGDYYSEKIKTALTKLEKIGTAYNANSATLHAERKAAKKLLEQDLSTIIEGIGDAFTKYQDTFATALDTHIPTLEDTKIYTPTSYNEDENVSTYYGTAFDDDNTPLQTVLSGSSNDTLALSLSIAEVLINNGLSNSFLLNAGELQTPSFTLSNDGHSFPAIPTTYYYSKYFQGLLACLNEFIGGTKGETGIGSSNFDNTVIHLASEFGRNPKASGVGSDHGYTASNTTLISGMITSPEIIGDISMGLNDGSTYAGSWGEASVDVSVKSVHNTIANLFGLGPYFTTYGTLYEKYKK